MENDIYINLTKKQQVACYFASGVILVLLAIFLILCACNSIHLNFSKVFFTSILCSLFLICFVLGLIQNNTVLFFISFVFLTCAIVNILVMSGSSYSKLYPFYVAIPAISSFFTLFMGKAKMEHLKVILLFGVLSGLFFLQSFSILDWQFVIPFVLLYFGLLITIFAILLKREKI